MLPLVIAQDKWLWGSFDIMTWLLTDCFPHIFSSSFFFLVSLLSTSPQQPSPTKPPFVLIVLCSSTCLFESATKQVKMTGLLSNQINHLDFFYSFNFDSALRNETIVNILDLGALYSDAMYMSGKNILHM